jgi:hypothetical protein
MKVCSKFTEKLKAVFDEQAELDHVLTEFSVPEHVTIS